MQKRRQQWSVLSQRRTPMFPLFSFFSSLFSLAASDCRMLLHMCVIVFVICHVLSLCVVLYSHVYIYMWLYYRSCATTVCGYMYTCVTVYITGHMLSLCAVLYLYTYIQIYVIVYRSCAITMCGFCTSDMGIVCLGWSGGWGEGLYIQLRLVVQKLQHVWLCTLHVVHYTSPALYHWAIPAAHIVCIMLTSPEHHL